MCLAKNRPLVCELCVVATLALLSVILQIAVGDFPLSMFRFPLNLILFVGWLATLVVSYNRYAQSRVVQSLLSRRATWLSLGLLVVVGVWLGLQREPASRAWPIVVSLLYVLSHLTLVTLRGWRNERGVRWLFLLNHLGLWLALVAGFWGAPDCEQVRVMVADGLPTNEAFDSEGRTSRLDYTLHFVDFEEERYADGSPVSFVAQVEVDGRRVALRANHPYRRSLSEMLYLVSYDAEPNDRARYCVVEVVREPWQWLSMVGIVMLIVGAVLMFVRGPRREVER